MHIQIVTFGLNGVTEDQYHQVCESSTGTFAALPGLLAKVWLRNEQANTYGGVYLWRDRRALDRYLASDVYRSIQSDGALAGVRSVDFGVFEDLTKATQPELLVV